MAARGGKADWLRPLSTYEKPDARKAVWELLSTFVPYIALWAAMVTMVRHGVSYWLVLPLITVAAGLLVRVFIIFHDCCHGSFFASRRANQILGYVTGVFVFTAYEGWQHAHARHHATAGDLDRRGTGDVWTMTVDEYRHAPWTRRFAYRVYRNPLVLFVLGPPLVFFMGNRFSRRGATPRERRSILITDLAILAIVAGSVGTIGLHTYLMIQGPLMAITASLGVWLFYVQHQFEGVYWSRHPEWSPTEAAMAGSSYYRLPKVLQWFTGNIGLHHLHHLRPRIPFYNLQDCQDRTPEAQAVIPLTLRSSLKSLSLNLWDEEAQTLVSFRSLEERSGRPRRPEPTPGARG